MTLPDVLATLPQEVQDKYDFGNATYKNALVRMEGIVCRSHGVFSQYSGALRKGIGCPSCGAEQRAAKLRFSLDEFYARVTALHGGAYSYPNRNYVSMHKKIDVVCPRHGAFSISPLKHYYSKQGCPACGAEKRGIRTSGKNVGELAAITSIRKHAAMFVERATAVHKGLYDYSKVTYVGIKQEVTIICKKHGEFQQRPEKHIYEGQGCPRCSVHLSKQEDVLARFLAIFTPVIQRDRTILKPKELDIYMPEKKLAVEYCGMFWHSHGDKESERKDKLKHFQKHKDCEAAGIRLITVFESDWQRNPKAVKRLLRNAIGKSKGRLMARKCEMKKVSNSEAAAFYDRYHPQGGAGHGEHYGLYWKGKLVACMRFVFGANDRGAGAAKRVWTLGRYATRLNVAGAASKLFKAFLADHNPPAVKSFSDNRYFTGAMYPQLGFHLEEDVSPDYQVWSAKLGLRPKPHYQRRQLPKRLDEHGLDPAGFDPQTDQRTEAEVTYLMGARRIYDCGKKRWLYTP